MSEETPPGGRLCRVGSDRVLVGDDRLVIHSPVDMYEWQVREFSKPLIHFEDRTWTVVRKSSGHGDTVRYELEPWSPSVVQPIGPEIRYDAAYVERRDRERSAASRRDLALSGLILVSPLVGFLGAGTKRRLEQIGLDPVVVTKRSIYLEYFVVLISGALAAIGMMVNALGRPSPWPNRPLLILALVVGVDAVLRYDRVMREERYPPGFYQWLWLRGRGRGKSRRDGS